MTHFFTTSNGAQARMPDLDEEELLVAADFATDLTHWLRSYIDTPPPQRRLILPWHSRTLQGNYMMADLGRPYMLLPEFTQWLGHTPRAVAHQRAPPPPELNRDRAEEGDTAQVGGMAQEGGQDADTKDVLWPSGDDGDDPQESPSKQAPAA